MKRCKFCFKEFQEKENIGSHTRWCKKNPELEFQKSRTSIARAAKTNETYKKVSRSIKKRWEEGAYANVVHQSFLGKTHSDESKELIRQGALNSNHRRLKKKTILYNGILLDSSWELALAQRLDELNVKWERPNPIKWVDTKNVTHNYFPDFYLPEYDLYLDPKNPIAFESQKEKISIIAIQIKNLRFLKSLQECKTYAPVV